MIATRSTIDPANLQEMLDASGTSAKHTTMKGQAQYPTPPWFAERMTALLPARYSISVAVDPQCGDGALLNALQNHGLTTVGIDIDRRFEQEAKPNWANTDVRITANCVDVWRIKDEMYPALTLRCQVANPPFGLTWKSDDGSKEDSTKLTWTKMIEYAGGFGCGYMIANRATIEKLKLHESEQAYLYQTFPTGIFDAEVEIGVLHFHGSHATGPHLLAHESASEAEVLRRTRGRDGPSYRVHGSAGAEVAAAFENIRAILAEEKRKVPPFNIYLDANGYLRTYLSTREKISRKLTVPEITRLATVNNCSPLTMTTDRDTRVLMEQLSTGDGGKFTVQLEAWAAMKAALEEVALISCPIMDITDFERVAYADEKESLEALATSDREGIRLTKGRHYNISTATYKFTDHYTRMRLHLRDKSETYACEHDCTLSGQDRFISLVDDRFTLHRFLDKPMKLVKTDHSDAILWDLFVKPDVPTVATRYPNDVKKNLAVMEACEMLAGFEYFGGQREFYSRVAVRDYALVGAATGTGKTLGAITLIALKAPTRALIIAPQGTTRGRPSDDEDEIEDLQASQWISELQRFAPGLQVFELFNPADYERILALNGGELPHGVYVSYYEAMFSNGGRETCKPGSKYNDRVMAKQFGLVDPDPKHVSGTSVHTSGIGHEKNGIRCIVTPCLATRIGHLFDFIALDEAHKMCHLSANVTQMIIRLQPKYRYALTATPIPNLASDIFPLMGWLCVPGWFRGRIRNAAWPYSREEHNRFATTFLSIERDLTQEEMNKDQDPKNRGKVTKISPVIASPARLLKLIKPTVAYISKEACNPQKPKVTVHDVRVPMGAAQAKLYGHYMNRANVPHDNPMVQASMQISILRALCAAPATNKWNNVPELLVLSNFNAKMAAVLSLVRDILDREQQVLIVCARMAQSDYLERRLSEAGIPVARIDSNLPPERHSEEANLFKKGLAPVMLMGIKCAQAHSFEQCPNLIIGSLEYSWGSFDQASGRIDRVTSKLPMNIYCVLTRNSIEEIMFDVVATKGDAAIICLRGERVPRNFVAADLGDILAKNFEQFKLSSDQPEEAVTEAGWPQICKGLRTAIAKHPCQLARKDTKALTA